MVWRIDEIELANKLYPIVKDRRHTLDNDLEKIILLISELSKEVLSTKTEYDLEHEKLVSGLLPLLKNGFKTIAHLKKQLNAILNAVSNSTTGLKIILETRYPKRIRRVPDRLTYERN